MLRGAQSVARVHAGQKADLVLVADELPAYDSRMPLRAFLTVAILALGGSAVFADSDREFLRGMVVSCPRAGQIWGAPEMAESLAELSDLGVGSVAIHPYGWVKRDGSVEFRPAATLDFLSRAVELARDAEMHLFWKPHLGYWGQFEWRGAIEFAADEAAWERFFSTYEAFIVDQARFAQAAKVDLLAVGVELDATMHREREWRRIIASVRKIYGGRLVYAANWNRVNEVPVWDALDWIGVHAYFPLSMEDDPDTATLRNGWESHLAELRRASSSMGKPVLFAEIGYNSSVSAAREPWSYATDDSPRSRALRTRLIAVALDRIAAEDFIAGMYWWKWMPGSSHHRRNFSMRDPEARRLVASRWRQVPSVLSTAQ